jgi:hypothetical protein
VIIVVYALYAGLHWLVSSIAIWAEEKFGPGLRPPPAAAASSPPLRPASNPPIEHVPAQSPPNLNAFMIRAAAQRCRVPHTGDWLRNSIC